MDKLTELDIFEMECARPHLKRPWVGNKTSWRVWIGDVGLYIGRIKKNDDYGITRWSAEVYHPGKASSDPREGRTAREKFEDENFPTSKAGFLTCKLAAEWIVQRSLECSILRDYRLPMLPPLVQLAQCAE